MRVRHLKKDPLDVVISLLKDGVDRGQIEQVLRRYGIDNPSVWMRRHAIPIRKALFPSIYEFLDALAEDDPTALKKVLRQIRRIKRELPSDTDAI